MKTMSKRIFARRDERIISNPELNKPAVAFRICLTFKYLKLSTGKSSEPKALPSDNFQI